MTEFRPEPMPEASDPAESQFLPAPQPGAVPLVPQHHEHDPAATAQYQGPVPSMVEVPRGGSVALASVAALAAGLLAAFAYAAISYSIGREFLIAMVAVGWAVGATMALVARRESVATGLISLVVGAFSLLSAATMVVVFYAARSIPKGLSRVFEADIPEVLSAYFGDPFGFIWIGAGLFAAYAAGSGSKRAK